MPESEKPNGVPPDAAHLRPTVLPVAGPVGRGDIPRLCERLHTLLRKSEGGPVICDVAALGHPDAVTLDALARLQLTARRLGSRIWLRNAGPELRGLLALTGLADVLPLWPGSGLQVRGQAEEGEEPVGVEERIEPDDLSL